MTLQNNLRHFNSFTLNMPISVYCTPAFTLRFLNNEMCVVYHSETTTVLKQSADEIKGILDDTARAQLAAHETIKEVESDMNVTRHQIDAVSVILNYWSIYAKYDFF